MLIRPEATTESQAATIRLIMVFILLMKLGEERVW
ncbi:hypothetical protein PbB2_02478 [Candidatus Phycosocius bacilliformis]|uniref:Uncharacterized protein n=1 Tax=Candidatus Phycosocius bacilliformis TaxID=1445552 RepID=A0A2P2ECL7_9PROT|nr:hypothetical protein PbB2_02478 [Candidatus Phycosocius bacilliformis]